jgi:TolB protein
VNTDGANLHRLTKKGWAWASDPQWSPDSRRIVFEQTFPSNRIGPNTSEIYVVGVDGGSEVRLTRNGVADSSPVWSSDGRKVAFVRFSSCSVCPPPPSGDGEIFVMNADGTGMSRLTHNRVEESSPAWQSNAAP